MTLFFRRSFGVSFVQPFLLGYTKMHQPMQNSTVKFYFLGGENSGMRFAVVCIVEN
jgi:hypothetical protein